MKKDTAEYLRAQARRCRSLAAATLDQRVADTLRGMAAEYEERALLLKPPEEKGAAE